MSRAENFSFRGLWNNFPVLWLYLFAPWWNNFPRAGACSHTKAPIASPKKLQREVNLLFARNLQIFMSWRVELSLRAVKICKSYIEWEVNDALLITLLPFAFAPRNEINSVAQSSTPASCYQQVSIFVSYRTHSLIHSPARWSRNTAVCFRFCSTSINRPNTKILRIVEVLSSLLGSHSGKLHNSDEFLSLPLSS